MIDEQQEATYFTTSLSLSNSRPLCFPRCHCFQREGMEPLA